MVESEQDVFSLWMATVRTEKVSELVFLFMSHHFNKNQKQSQSVCLFSLHS